MTLKTLSQLGIHAEDTIRLKYLTYPEHGSHAALSPGDYLAKDFPLYILNLEPRPYQVIKRVTPPVTTKKTINTQPEE